MLLQQIVESLLLDDDGMALAVVLIEPMIEPMVGDLLDYYV